MVPIKSLPEFLTVAEVAAMVRVHPSTLEKWRAAGSGPRWVRLGRTRIAAKGRARSEPRYRREDVIAWLREREVPTRDQP